MNQSTLNRKTKYLKSLSLPPQQTKFLKAQIVLFFLIQQR